MRAVDGAYAAHAHVRTCEHNLACEARCDVCMQALGAQHHDSCNCRLRANAPVAGPSWGARQLASS
eukprot:15470135-Alexandrium_andersonii.AAC.1